MCKYSDISQRNIPVAKNVNYSLTSTIPFFLLANSLIKMYLKIHNMMEKVMHLYFLIIII